MFLEKGKQSSFSAISHVLVLSPSWPHCFPHASLVRKTVVAAAETTADAVRGIVS